MRWRHASQASYFPPYLFKSFFVSVTLNIFRGKSDLQKCSWLCTPSEEFPCLLRHNTNPIEITGPAASGPASIAAGALPDRSKAAQCFCPRFTRAVVSPFPLPWSLWVAALPWYTLTATLRATSIWYFSKPEQAQLDLGSGEMFLLLHLPRMDKE